MEFGQGCALEIASRPGHEPRELHLSESVSHRRLDAPEHLADPRLPAPNSVTGMRGCGKPVDQRAVQIEEGPDLRAGRARADLRDRIRRRRQRTHAPSLT